MPLPNKIQSAFTGGELAPALWGRTDLAKYQIGAKTLRNMFVHIEGGASNRPGTKYAFPLNEQALFVPFEFNEAQTYMLCFYDQRVMFLQGGRVVVTNLVSSTDGYEWKASPAKAGEYYFQKIGDADPGILQPKMLYENGNEMPVGTLGSLSSGQWAWGNHDSLTFNTIYVKVDTGVDPDTKANGWLQMPYVVESPYALADLPRLSFAQSYDTLFMAHKDFKTRKLVRYANDDWRWIDAEMVGGPLGIINSDTSKTIAINFNRWNATAVYTPGDIVLLGLTVNATASWIGTVSSFEKNSTIKTDLTTTSISESDRFYSASVWSNKSYDSYTQTTYPFTFIRIAKSSGLVAGNPVTLSLTFTESGGASTYAASGTINKIFTGTTYDYITVNLGWKFVYLYVTGDVLIGVLEAGCVPTGSASPNDPAGLTYPSPYSSRSENEKRCYCLQIGVSAANGGGAMVTAVSGNVIKTGSGTTAYQSIASSVNIVPGTTSGWQLYWIALAAIPSTVASAEITASGHAPFTAQHVGMLMGLAEPNADRTIANKWNIAAAAVAYSAQLMVIGEVTMWTEGSWSGEVHLQKSLNDGATWEEVASIHSVNADHNGTLMREIAMPSLMRLKFVSAAAQEIKAYLRAESTYTHVVKITIVSTTQSVVGTVQYGSLTEFSTTLWSFGSFGESSGYPGAVGIFQQRLMYARTDSEPKTLWGSRTSNFVNFANSDLQLATEPINYEVSLSKQYEIRHLVPLKSLLILTAGSWHSLAGTDGSLTPTNGDMTLHGYGGVLAEVAPLIVGLSVLCVQTDGRTVSELRYSLASDGYDRTELSVMSKHLFRGKTIKSWALADNPEHLVWVVMSDGSLLSFTFLREQEVWAWTRHDTDGTFEAVGSVKSSTGGPDEVYFIVKRTVGAQTKYFVEYLSQRLPSDVLVDGIFMDCAVSYSGTPATVISGLGHLEGKAVAVLADGVVVTGKTVASGQITLASAASKVHVGLAYTAEIETLNLEFGERMSSQGRTKAVRKVVVRCQNTKGFQIGPDSARLTTPNCWGKLAAGTVFTGDVEHRIKGDWATDGSVVIRQSDPLPLTVNAVVPFVELGE